MTFRLFEDETSLLLSIGQTRVLVIGTNMAYPIKGSKEEEREFDEIGCSESSSLYPFCNAKDVSDDDKECLTRLWKHIDEYNDPNAMNMVRLVHQHHSHSPRYRYCRRQYIISSSSTPAIATAPPPAMTSGSLKNAYFVVACCPSGSSSKRCVLARAVVVVVVVGTVSVVLLLLLLVLRLWWTVLCVSLNARSQ